MASKTLGSELTEQLISPTNLSQVSSSHDNGDLDRSRTKKYNYLPSQEVDTSKVKDKLFERRKSNPSVRTKVSCTKGAFGNVVSHAMVKEGSRGLEKWS